MGEDTNRDIRLPLAPENTQATVRNRKKPVVISETKPDEVSPKAIRNRPRFQRNDGYGRKEKRRRQRTEIEI